MHRSRQDQPANDAMPRHKSLERPPAGRNIRIELDGVSYDGTYRVDGSMVTTESLTLGVKCAPLRDGSAEALAKLLLAELADAHERRNRM